MNLALYTGDYRAAPHLVWQDLLASENRVRYAADIGVWLISGHGPVRAAFADQQAFRNAQTLMPIYQPVPAAAAILAKIDAPPTTAAADPPTHPRTRRALKAAFASGRSTSQAYEHIVTRRVNELVQQLAARRRSRVDLVAEFASVLPLAVVADIIGVPQSDLPRVKAWADGQIALVWGRPNAAEQVRLAQDLLDFWTYSQQLVTTAIRAHAAGHRTDTFISRLLQWRTRAGDNQVSDAEIASLAFNLLVAGHETTAGLLAHALDHALAAPQRWPDIATRSDAATEHVAETLRFSPPIDGWLRTTSRPVTIGAITIPAGARCLLLIGAANRDPARFHNPNTFQPGRPEAADHLSFGHGPHYCIGAALARLEATTALQAFAAAFPHMRPAPDYQRVFHPNAAFRALRTLPILLEPTPGAPPRHVEAGGHHEWL